MAETWKSHKNRSCMGIGKIPIIPRFIGSFLQLERENIVKTFLYVLTFVVSAGTIGVVATNPTMVPQGVSFLGLTSSPPAATSSADDNLEKFLSQYPYANQEDALPQSDNADTVFGATQPGLLRREAPKPAIITASALMEEPAGMASTSPAELPAEKEDSGFATTNASSVYEPGNLGGWSDPVVEGPPPVPPVAVISEGNTVPVALPTPAVPSPIPPPLAPPVMPPIMTPESGNAPFSAMQPGPLAVPVPAMIPVPELTATPVAAAQSAPPPGIIPVAKTQPSDNAAAGNTKIVPPEQTPPHDPFLQAGVAASDQAVTPHPFANPTVAPPAVASHNAPVIPPAENAPFGTTRPGSLAAAPQPAVPQQKAASQFQITPSIVAQEIPCHGTEVVARVGREIILMCDILPQLRRAGIRYINEQLEKMPPAERAKIPKEEIDRTVDAIVQSQYPVFLQAQIKTALLYNDFFVAKSPEEREGLEKKFAEEFDSKEVPELVKEFKLRDTSELKRYLKDELGSSLERERMLWLRSMLAHQWNLYAVESATAECTHDEMMEFYTANKEKFTSKARAQWQELFVSFSKHKSEDDARMKMAWMGNQVANGLPFEEIAKKNSDGFTADKGGLWDWTQRGSLSSPELENAVFSQAVGMLSPIIRTDKGLHVIRVVKREEAQAKPFVEAQVIIREQIRLQRRQKNEQEYFEKLDRKYPTIVLKEKIDFDLSRSGGH